jgi:hypothetical protein
LNTQIFVANTNYTVFVLGARDATGVATAQLRRDR